MPKEAIVNVKNLTIKYSDFVAVDNVSLTIYENEVIGIIGPNGAGKTSLVEAIEGLRAFNNGEVEILGLDPIKDRIKLYNELGVQLQESSYPDRAKVEDVCELFSSFYNVGSSHKALLEDFGLTHCTSEYIRNLSGGEKQKLSILLSLLCSPKIVFWDELTTGLDPLARHELYEKILDYKSRGLTIVLVTHYMEEIEKLCDRVAVMRSGKILAVGTPNEIVEKFNANDLDDVFMQISKYKN